MLVGAVDAAPRGQGAEPSSAPVLGVVRTLATARGGLEARLVEAARVVVAACAEELLVRKGFTSVEELTPGQRRRWRAEGKAAAVDELVSCLGVTSSEARDLVGLSLAGGRVPALVITALEEGRASWWQVRMFWSRCRVLPLESAELVALSLFGTQADLAHRDRLDPDGNLSTGPWDHHAYRAALASEATRMDGKDPAAERARRRAAHEARHATMVAHEDGTATLALTGDLISLVGAYTRIEKISRLMRKHGDGRTLSQLSFDVAAAFLVHGIIPVLDKDPDDLTAEDLELLARVATAQPQVSVEVVVPFDTLTGSPACPSCGHGYPARVEHGHPARVDPESREPVLFDDAESTRALQDGPGAQAVDRHGERPTQPGAEATRGSPAWPPPGWAPPRQGGIAQVAGRQPAFLTPAHARELACRPGTTIHRLLTDVRDGRLVERTQTTYRPDAAMRAQVYAADRYCRGPRLASRRPAPACEIDHVIPYAVDDDGRPIGGPTALRNLVLLAQHPHHRKTRDEFVVAINARRDLTWTTLLAQTVSTRSFDYRQFYDSVRTELGPHDASDRELADRYRSEVAADYRDAAQELLRERRGRAPAWTTSPFRGGTTSPSGGGTTSPSRGESTPPSEARTAVGDVTPEDRNFLRDVAARALYAALVHRGPDTLLGDPDDEPGATEHGGPLAGWMFVGRAGMPTGRPTDHPTPEQVLGLPGKEITSQGEGEGERGGGGGGRTRADEMTVRTPDEASQHHDQDSPPPPF